MTVPTFSRQLLTGLRLLLLFTVLLGVLYPAAMWVVGRTAFADQAGGSPVVVDGQVRGSRIIGQAVAPGSSADGWFLPRPSVGDYDAQASGGTNLGPSDADLVIEIAKRRAEIAEREGVDPAQVPADALTSSASGLDPFISPAYAALQQARVARVRGWSLAVVQQLVAASTSGRTLGFLGQPRVNVVTLNAAVAERAGRG